MSINEIRQKENMNMVEEGDNLFMQLNMATLETIVKGAATESGDDEQLPVEEPTEEIDVDVDIDEEEVKTNGVLKH